MPHVEKTIELQPTEKFRPQKVVGSGDADFDGNGPEVNVSAELTIENGNQLWVRVAMHAIETEEDNSEARGSANLEMWRNEYPIVRIISSTFSHGKYTDDDHKTDRIPGEGGELVREFECTGDRKGDDVGTSTGVIVHFNPIKIIEDRP